ncbi:hypothetical protein RM844_30205 [Streptomyces sp. DSM 44915]|uniref:Uncharacterized protein n=1 Tax=Streptomyces chisholmiae TaxID=3075540 RepID=A0ABU2K000_9ACTN|nr:hypothetical protein [Streptomyces sp. DSM 44915]MDT0270554.1 hypothetical protein [Streptomyces sp. DSM 44915]
MTPEESAEAAAEAARLAEEQRRRIEAGLREHAAEMAATTSPLKKTT